MTRVSTVASARGPVVFAAGLIALSLATVSAPLDGDVRYEIGTQVTSPASPAGTFTHRPLMYRLIMSWLIRPANRLSDGLIEFERVVRLESLALAFLAGLLLWAGLRRRWPAVAATLSLTVAGVLALIGPATVLEPEWLAVVATVAGVGVALALPSRPPWGLLSAVLGGLLLSVAAAIKVVTLPIAVIGLLVLLLVDRRRCVIATIAALLGGLAWIVGVALEAPWEIQWMIDTAAMVPDRGGPDVEVEAMVFLGNVAVIWPTVTLLPAALIGVPRIHLVAGVLGVLLAWLPVTLQNQYFLYHASALPVIGAVLPLWSTPSRRAPVRPCRSWPCPGWTYYVLTNSADWRLAYQPELFTVAAVTAGVDGRAVDRLACLAVLPVPVGRAAPDRDPARHPGPRGRLAARLCPHRRRVGDSVHAQQHAGTQPRGHPGPAGLGRGDAPADRDGHAGDLPELRHHQLSARQPLHLRVPDERVPAAQPLPSAARRARRPGGPTSAA